MSTLKKIFCCWVVLFGLVTCSGAEDQEVVILSSLDETIAWLEKEAWWGEEKHKEQLTMPRAIIVAIKEQWQKSTPTLEANTKKEIFYRFMLPLVVHANTMVLDRCDRLQRMAETLDKGKTLSSEDDEWPFDSVRGYFINLSSHPAYEDFRRLRAQSKAAGKPLRSLMLVDGLKSTSERGADYVKTLESIIRVNNLHIADDAVFRDEPMRFLLGAADKTSAEEIRKEIKKMKKSGEFDQIVERMRLD